MTPTKSADMTPEQARRVVATTAKPGREYTAQDLATISGVPFPQSRAAANWLVRNEMFVRNTIETGHDVVHVYQRNEAWVDGARHLPKQPSVFLEREDGQ